MKNGIQCQEEIPEPNVKQSPEMADRAYALANGRIVLKKMEIYLRMIM